MRPIQALAMLFEKSSSCVGRSMAAAGLQVMLLRMRALPAHQVSDSCAT